MAAKSHRGIERLLCNVISILRCFYNCDFNDVIVGSNRCQLLMTQFSKI